MKESRHSLYRLFFFTLAILITASCAERKRFDGYLYPIHENGLYGYIDSVGNRIIEPAFLWVSTFHNGLAMAVVDTIYLEVPDSMAFEVGEMDTIINVYRMYAKYGYIDRSGEFVIEPKFTSYVNMPNIGSLLKIWTTAVMHYIDIPSVINVPCFTILRLGRMAILTRKAIL